MGRHCTICESTQRPAIEAAILERKRTRDICDQYGVTRRQIQGHQKHLATEASTAVGLAQQGKLDLDPNMSDEKKQRLSTIISAYDELLDLRAKARRIYKTASGKNADANKLGAVRELTNIVELAVKLQLVQLRADDAANKKTAVPAGCISIQAVKGMLMRVIASCPQAKSFIVAELATLSEAALSDPGARRIP